MPVSVFVCAGVCECMRCARHHALSAGVNVFDADALQIIPAEDTPRLTLKVRHGISIGHVDTAEARASPHLNA